MLKKTQCALNIVFINHIFTWGSSPICRNMITKHKGFSIAWWMQFSNGKLWFIEGRLLTTFSLVVRTWKRSVIGKYFEINFCIGRDLEKRIADLEELNGYEAPRTGGEARLNTKITGLFLHYPRKQNWLLCDNHHRASYSKWNLNSSLFTHLGMKS
jgi:hypothetical protein